ncbi:TolC family protein [bacterium]|nr:TolC family protein [bacterium]
MKSIIFLAFTFICGAFSSFLYADECAINSSQDILNCAVNRHPEVQIAEASLKRDEALKKIAKQLPNPEIETKVLSGHSNSDSVVNTEINVSQTIELGGKRKNRIKQAKATAGFTQAQVLESKELTALNTVLALYRLRQIRSEIAAVNEGIGTFQHTIEHFKSRPKLAPEQEVSSTVFKLSLDDFKIRKAQLTQEQTELQSFLVLATNLPLSTIQKYLPPSKRKWPQLAGETDTLQNAELAKAQADQAITKANLKLAKSSIWPDFKVGPSFTNQTGIPGNNKASGINVTLALPIFSFNGGNVSYAKQDAYRASLAYQLTVSKKENERAQLLSTYRSALQSLGRIHPNGALQNEHKNMENYYESGLVSSSLVIETHRQIFEVTQSLNAQELTAINALWRIYILDGTWAGSKI